MADVPLILPLDRPDPPMELVGGKARGLAMLIDARLPVPPGFCITTRAFQQFSASIGLEPALLQNADSKVTADSTRRRILNAEMPEALATAIVSAYSDLANTNESALEQDAGFPVAVRSSATAEDSPERSFAGLQASFLNITGGEALLEATLACWASLYNDRALIYRQRSGVAEDSVAMAVVVQQLLPADAAGVLFTANPATGARNEVMINGSLGLGEAVVSGTVTPDSWLLDRESLNVKEAVIGSKATRIDSSGASGTVSSTVPEAERQTPVLAVSELKLLARLGLAAEMAAGGAPQDIEWVMSSGQCHLVQSRPITNLPPLPIDASWVPPPGVEHLFRRQVVENMSAPLSPLFEELYLGEGLDAGMDQLMKAIGLPLSMKDFIHPPMFMTVNGYGYLRYDMKFGWRFLPLIAKTLFYSVTRLPKVVSTLTSRWEQEGLAAYQEIIERWRSINVKSADDETLISGIRELAHADARYWGYITMMVGSAKITEGMLAGFLNSPLVPGTFTSGAFLRGFPSKTLEAQESLAGLAADVSPELRQRIDSESAADILAVPQSDREAEALQEAIEKHMETYGQQIFDLDFITPTLAERPEVVVDNLRRLLNRDTSAESPSAHTITAERDALTEALALRLGPIRRWCFRKLLAWAQKYGPHREAALFYMGAGWPVLRTLALHLGDRLVRRGILNKNEDMFFLTSTELIKASESTSRTAPDDLLALRLRVSERFALRESRKRLHPPARVPEDLRVRIGPFDLTRFFETWETQKHNEQDANSLSGFAVSPGKVTGSACVVRSPADFHKMRPGSVLVCSTTTPAWTPLFIDAIGLVTDIGAVLAHGSIVAREYGIPAVMGTGNGTNRIADGDLVTVDGDSGRVTLTGPRAIPTE